MHAISIAILAGTIYPGSVISWIDVRTGDDAGTIILDPGTITAEHEISADPDGWSSAIYTGIFIPTSPLILATSSIYPMGVDISATWIAENGSMRPPFAGGRGIDTIAPSGPRLLLVTPGEAFPFTIGVEVFDPEGHWDFRVGPRIGFAKVVPEPATCLLLGIGVVGILMGMIRKTPSPSRL